jgi:hypothetical protein
MKGQTIRLLDVFFIGPLMFWGGMVVTEKKTHLLYGSLLMLMGAATIVYNGANYLTRERFSNQEVAGPWQPPQGV